MAWPGAIRAIFSMLYSFSCPAGYSLSAQYGPIGCLNASGQFALDAVIVPVSLQPESIDPATNFSDGATLGWGVAAAMAAAWGVVHLRKALFR